MNISRAARTRLVAATAAPLLALGLVACGDSDDDASDSPAPAPAPASSTTSSSEPAPSAAASGSAPAAPSGDVLLTAAATALAAVDGGTVFAVDRDDSGEWEVSVVTGDGTEQDVRVSADGASITAGPVEDTDDSDDSGDAARDQDERLRLLDATVDLEAAVAAASGSASGDLFSAELDEENGVAQWEVQYGEDTPDELTVHLDANTGEVLRTERDD